MRARWAPRGAAACDRPAGFDSSDQGLDNAVVPLCASAVDGLRNLVCLRPDAFRHGRRRRVARARDDLMGVRRRWRSCPTWRVRRCARAGSGADGGKRLAPWCSPKRRVRSGRRDDSPWNARREPVYSEGQDLVRLHHELREFRRRDELSVAPLERLVRDPTGLGAATSDIEANTGSLTSSDEIH